MNLLEMLSGTLGSDESVASLAEKTGGSKDQISSLISDAVPVLLSSMTQNASSQEGAQSLLGALSQHKSTDNVVMQLEEADEEDGGKILGHILGDNQTDVMGSLSERSGLSASLVTKILSMLAPALLSGVSAATHSASNQVASQVDLSDGLDLSDLMGMFGGSKPAGSGGGLLGSLLGGSGGGLLGSLFGGGGSSAANESQANGTSLLGALTSLMK